MIIERVLRSVLPHLERLGIPYLITGGIASTLHGRPRFTQDIDFVIAPSREQVERLVDALDQDFVISRDAARDAHARRGEFNAIHFCIFAVRSTIDAIRFLPRPKTVGGPIDVLAIKPDRAFWVQRKDLHGTSTT